MNDRFPPVTVVPDHNTNPNSAFFRVHHFARQLASPFPHLASIGAKTRRIGIGTAVIDMRCENPLTMAEDASVPMELQAVSSASDP